MKFEKVSWGLLFYLIISCTFMMILMFIFIADSIVYLYVYYKTGIFKWSFNDIFYDVKHGTIAGIIVGISTWILIKIEQLTGYRIYKDNNKHTCPCCEKHIFDKKEKSETCPICGWINDPLQSLDPDYKDGRNKISLNQARINFRNQRQKR